MIQNNENNLKKLLYLSMYRGCKESEIIFTKFAKKYLQNLNSSEQKAYEELLNYPDAILMDWLMYKKNIPSEISQNIIYKLLLKTMESD